MKKLFIFLTMLVLGIVSSWAALSSNTIAKSGVVTDTWNITSALPTDDWTAMGDNTPAGVTALGSYTAYSRTQDLTLSADGALFITYQYSSGSHRLEILGVDLLDQQGNVVRSDYHFGYTGTQRVHNIYMLDHITSGSYKIRFIINSGVSSSVGNITVKHVNIKTASSFADISQWYFVRMHSNQTHYMFYNGGNSITFGGTKANEDKYLWGFVKDTDGIKIYNKAAGSSVAIDNKTPCTLSESGQTFSIWDSNVGSQGAASGAYFALYQNNTSGSKSYLNYQSGNIKRWSSNDEGSTFMIDEASIAGGKIYKIKAYFSDATGLYFTNSNGTLEFNTSATNGVKDYWILRSSGNADYPWKFESGRGDGKFLSNNSATEGVTNIGVYLQINNCGSIASNFHFRGSMDGDAKTTGIVNLATWDGSTNSGFGAYGTGSCWSSSGHNVSDWTTDYLVEEVTDVSIYTVVSNIDAGGVRYTPSYTGVAEQTNGGFYIFSSTPSASDFTKISVDNYSPGDITVDASTKTITLNYACQITDVTSISSSKVYRLRTDRTAIYAASTSATAVSGTSTASASTLSIDEPLNQWAFVEKDSKKYLYNVGAKKFVKTSPYVDYNTPDYGQYSNNHNFMDSYTTHEVQVSDYGETGRFWLKDVKSNRTRVYNTGSATFTINGWADKDAPDNLGNGWIIEEIPGYTFDPTEALAALDNSISYTFRKVNGDTDEDLTSSDEERDVATGSTLNIAYNEYYYTPILKMKEITVNGSSSSVGTKIISNGDVIEWVYKCPFIVSDEPSAGAFAENTHWHLLDIHSGSHYYLNIPQDFNYTNKIPANTTKRSFTDDFLWCITGNNTDGYRLYNKQAGPTKVMTFTSGTGAFMSNLSGNENASLFTMQHTNLSGASNTTGAPTFQFTGASARPNFDHVSAVASWANSDKGSEFTFEPIEESIIEDLANNYMPYFVQNIGNVCGLSWDDALYTSDLAEEYAAVYVNPTVDGYNTFVTHLNAAKVRPVENAKYHIISAYPNYKEKQGVRKALYYDTSASIFKWKTYDSSDEVFTFQLRKTEDNWNIYNPSASKYLKDCQGSNNASDDPSTFTFTDLGLAQLNISDGTGTMHTGGHSEGAGISGTITRWGGGLNSASSWYIEPIVETVSALTPDAVAKDAYVYQTFANPYDCQIFNGEVYYITTQTKSTAHIEQATNNIVPANTGVVLKAKRGATINVRPLCVEYDEKLKTENSLVPGDGSTTVTAGNYMLAYSSSDDMAKFYAIGAAGYVVPANKAYLPAEAIGARSLTLSFDDDPTGVNSIENEPSGNDNVIYNIVGQKLNKMQKGINIVNGKKVLVK